MARWAAVVGAKGKGMSGHASRIVEQLRERGVQVGGFFQKGEEDDIGRRFYNLHRISGKQVVVLARPTSEEEKDGQTTYCSFAFVDSAFDKARKWLLEDLGSCSVVFIDEVSKLESNGQGHAETIKEALASSGNVVVVLCVRADQLFYVVEAFDLEDDAIAILEVPSKSSNESEFVKALVQTVRG